MGKKIILPSISEELASRRKAANPLEGVAFSSASAETAARDAGLTAESFKGRHKTGAKGFTVADVGRIAGA